LLRVIERCDPVTKSAQVTLPVNHGLTTTAQLPLGQGIPSIHEDSHINGAH
jgi:hypothetical protein